MGFVTRGDDVFKSGSPFPSTHFMLRFVTAAEDVFLLGSYIPVVSVTDVLLALRACKGLANLILLFFLIPVWLITSSVSWNSVSRFSVDTQLRTARLLEKALPAGKSETRQDEVKVCDRSISFFSINRDQVRLIRWHCRYYRCGSGVG